LPEDASQHGKQVCSLPHPGDGVLTNRPAECHGHLPVGRQAQFRPNIVDHLQHAPAKLLRHPGLDIQRVAGFIRKTGHVHCGSFMAIQGKFNAYEFKNIAVLPNRGYTSPV
jgi:hypothetical protein